MNQPTTTVRLVSFFAAAAVASVLIASQFGLAGHYGTEAGVLLAQGSLPQPVAQASAAAARLPA